MKTPENIQQEIVAFKEGNAESFQTIYESSYKYLHTCVIHVVKDEEIAADMLQETYLEIFKSMEQLRSEADFLSWAAVIANRKCFAYLKKQRDVLLDEKIDEEGNVNDFFENISDDEAIIPEEVLQDAEKVRLIKEIIDGLTDMQRLCVIGFYYNEQSQEEIANELGIPVNTVKSHLNRAKGKIKEAVLDLEENKNTKLYAIAPFLLLLFLQESDVYAAEATIPQMGEALQDEMQKKLSKKRLQLGKTGKIAMIATTAVVAIGGIWAVTNKNQTEPPKDTEMVEIVEDSEKMIIAEETEQISETEQLETEEMPETEEALEVIGLPEGMQCDVKEASDQYDYYGLGAGNVILVKQGELWGAVNYQMEEIVPCIYPEMKVGPNDQGYFILADDEKRYLFSPSGEIIYSGTEWFRASGNYYAMIKYDDDCYSEEAKGNIKYKMQYYTYDGQLMLETEIQDFYLAREALIIAGEIDGNTTVCRVVNSPRDGHYAKDEIGQMNSNGEVEWTTIYEGPSDEEDNAGGLSFYLSVYPISSMNKGYYITKSAANYRYRMYNAQNQECLYFNSGTSGKTEDFISATSMGDGNFEFISFYKNGSWFYNYGTKMNWKLGDQYFLMDLGNVPWMKNDYQNDSLKTLMRKRNDMIDSSVILGVYEQLCMNNENLWLVKQDGTWKYIDHEGNIALDGYDDASEFYQGVAMIVKNHKAYLIDESGAILQECGSAESVVQKGGYFVCSDDDEIRLVFVDGLSDE